MYITFGNQRHGGVTRIRYWFRRIAPTEQKYPSSPGGASYLTMHITTKMISGHELFYLESLQCPDVQAKFLIGDSEPCIIENVSLVWWVTCKKCHRENKFGVTLAHNIWMLIHINAEWFGMSFYKIFGIYRVLKTLIADLCKAWLVDWLRYKMKILLRNPYREWEADLTYLMTMFTNTLEMHTINLRVWNTHTQDMS